ncbi:Nitrate reductase [Streptomyces sp. YIM 130001]|uniref:molybdopterin oxidoreductase family protein n=1 Tax=Streptomyces sp. YIM 130001 TaxID=2259644 RepID=UPI000E649BEB|nr:nitrate reductase [Streptomyces sp. YIM 130001]RII17925.1 Nitrate reductase [Streptomyces sp. YIM 130001]
MTHRTRDRIADPWGEPAPGRRGAQWTERVDQWLADGVRPEQVDRWVRSACLLCSNGCGLDIAVRDGRMVGVRGRAGDEVNRGRLGPKGLFGWQGQQSGDRLRRPQIRNAEGWLRETDWDTAMSLIVRRSQELLADRGPLTHGFYSSGQLMIEEYYTLAVLGKAGLGTPHMDGNTRLCTATAASALKESFGADGQPGTYGDIEHTDALFLYGHNPAETQTVLWARMRDRLRGPDRPFLVCVDPRSTVVAREADVHLAVRPGTNLALMNALTQQIIAKGWVDEVYVDRNTRGFEELSSAVSDCTPTWAADICGVAATDIERAAEIFGTSERVLSTVLQGFYQSHQATASSAQVNNLHLLRGKIGTPGCGILQMNGQPTAQNNRECGADGDLPGFRNWDNEEHVQELADLWNVERLKIPHWAEPTHAMQIFRYVEQGSVNFLWIAGSNPAVSLPEARRARATLASDTCFTVVSDAYPTETTALADVVLPAALWGEKTGTYTNTDRTVHLSEQAVAPPGEARSDLDIWLEYARRMGFTNRDGDDLIPWTDPEGAYEGWQACSRGRPCDYSDISYRRLRDAPGGIQWPCTDAAPDGTARLYGTGQFPTTADGCQTYGHDLATGGTYTRQEHEALRLDGRARLRPAHYEASPEAPRAEYPLLCMTGRTVYQWHTRTKTGRAPRLNDAAPSPWVEISPEDAGPYGITEGDLVRVESPRGAMEAPARICGTRPGTVFVPFHYGDQAANELTRTLWDPVSKQPVYKVSAVRLRRLGSGHGRPAPAPVVGAAAPTGSEE